jgi:hypothetical protein
MTIGERHPSRRTWFHDRHRGVAVVICWEAGALSPSCRGTQNVRRILQAACGAGVQVRPALHAVELTEPTAATQLCGREPLLLAVAVLAQYERRRAITNE